MVIPSELTVEGIEGLDGCWALDRFAHPELGLTRTGLLLGRAKVSGMGPAGAQLGERMAAVMAARRWADDVVVAAVPSASDLSLDLARRVAEGIDRPLEKLLGVRTGLLGRLDGSVRGRIKARVASSPKRVLLVDDAIRSGETLRACAAMLRARGADEVWAMTAVAILDVPNSASQDFLQPTS
ncbi:MAG: phosphoribosyltransferase [Acidimicrobiales bacterium]